MNWSESVIFSKNAFVKTLKLGWWCFLIKIPSTHHVSFSSNLLVNPQLQKILFLWELHTRSTQQKKTHNETNSIVVGDLHECWLQHEYSNTTLTFSCHMHKGSDRSCSTLSLKLTECLLSCKLLLHSFSFSYFVLFSFLFQPSRSIDDSLLLLTLSLQEACDWFNHTTHNIACTNPSTLPNICKLHEIWESMVIYNIYLYIILPRFFPKFHVNHDLFFQQILQQNTNSGRVDIIACNIAYLSISFAVLLGKPWWHLI